MLRTQCNQRWAGAGIELAFEEREDLYYDNKVDCRLPCDDILDKPEELKKLSGEVITYNLSDLGGEDVETKSSR